MMAIPAKMAMRNSLSINKVRINNRAIKKPRRRIFPERPSRYKTKMKEKNTSAEPVSF